MSGFRERLAEDAKRAEALAKRAQVTAVVAAHVLNPLVGPVAQQADLMPAQPMTEVSQEIQLEQAKDWAEYELARREREAGELQQARQEDREQPRQTMSRGRARKTGRSRER